MDVIQVATLHLHMCYVIVTTVVYGLRLSTSTLWNLFQGMIFIAFRICHLYLYREVLQPVVQSK